MSAKWVHHKIVRGLGASLVATLIATLIACDGRAGPVGPAGPTGPTGPTGPAGPNGGVPIFVTATGTAPLIVNDTVFRYTPIPGLSATLTVPAGATYKLLAETDAGIQLNSADPNASCHTDVAVFVDGAQVGSGRRVFLANTPLVSYSVTSFGFSVQATVSAGAHTVTVMAKQFPAIIAECYVSSGATGSGLPGNPRLQGILNVIAFP
jgi:hypothetical protein